MKYTVAYHEKVSGDIATVPKTVKARLRKAIEEKISQHPELFGKPLRKSLHGLRSHRVGDYRIVFKIKAKTVYVLAILHRSAIYKEMEKGTR